LVFILLKEGTMNEQLRMPMQKWNKAKQG